MPAATHGDFQFEIAAKLDGIGHVGGSGAARDDGRALIDEPVVNKAGFFISSISRPQQLSAEGLGQGFQ